jgi:sec-independent protein translocase protein TatA
MIAEIVGWEILVPLLLIVLLFGGAKIPELARSLGRAQHEFRRGAEGDHDYDHDDEDASPRS